MKKVVLCFLLVLGSAIVAPINAQQTAHLSALKKVNNQQYVKPITGIYFLLDSANITSFFKTVSASESVKNEVFQFYKSRHYQFAWVLENGVTVAASNFYQQVQSDGKDFADTHLSNVLLDSFFTTLKLHQKALLSQKKQVLQLELLLTTSFFKYARKMYCGITKESKSLEW